MVLAPAVALADALPPDPTPPKVSIKAPKNRTKLPAGTHRITVKVSAKDRESGVYEVVLRVDGEAVGTDDEPPFEFTDIELGPGEHRLVANATNNDGEDKDSKVVVVTVAEPTEPEPEPTEVGTPEVTAEPTENGTPEVTAEPKEVGTPEVMAEPTEAGTPETKAEVGTPETKAEPAAVGTPEAKAALAEADAEAEPAKAEATPATPPGETKDGCFASVRPRSLLGSGLALLFAAFAGLMLRRRRS